MTRTAQILRANEKVKAALQSHDGERGILEMFDSIAAKAQDVNSDRLKNLSLVLLNKIQKNLHAVEVELRKL